MVKTGFAPIYRSERSVNHNYNTTSQGSATNWLLLLLQGYGDSQRENIDSFFQED